MTLCESENGPIEDVIVTENHDNVPPNYKIMQIELSVVSDTLAGGAVVGLVKPVLWFLLHLNCFFWSQLKVEQQTAEALAYCILLWRSRRSSSMRKYIAKKLPTTESEGLSAGSMESCHQITFLDRSAGCFAINFMMDQILSHFWSLKVINSIFFMSDN